FTGDFEAAYRQDHVSHPVDFDRHRSCLSGFPYCCVEFYGCGPHGAAWSSLTSWVITSGRNFAAKPSTKSLFVYTAAQWARRPASSSNFQRWTSWLIVPVSAWK